MIRFLKFLTFILAVEKFFSQPSTYFIDNLLSEPELKGALISVSVKEIASQKILFEKNSTIQLVPASIFKLLTTFAALEKLGSNFKFKTEIYYSGSIQDSILNGDIIVKGYGDPTTESRFFKNSTLNEIAQSIKNLHIKAIKGHLILLNDYIRSRVCDNWTYEDVNNYYAAIPYSINIYDNQYHIYLKTDKPHQCASLIKIEPQYKNLPKILVTENNVIAREGGDNAYIYGDPLDYNKRIEGSIPPFQNEYSIEGALPHPPRMFAESLIQQINQYKIQIHPHQYRISEDTFNLKKLHLVQTFYSPALSDIIQLTNLHSINLFAEALLYQLGNGDYEKGKRELLTFAKKLGIANNEISIDDACGLSRLNGISTNAMTELLIKAYQSPYKSIFLKSLPVAGESGTMRNFSNTPPLKGNLKCKTGYFQRVRSFAGYMNTQSGKTIAFCIIYNNFNISSEKIKQITKSFLETLYQKF